MRRPRLRRFKNGLSKKIIFPLSKHFSLTDAYSRKLKSLKQICYYCGGALSEKTANSVCKTNKRSHYQINCKPIVLSKLIFLVGFTEETPDSDWHKTGRHFFGRPKLEVLRQNPQNEKEAETLSGSPLKNKQARLPYETFLGNNCLDQ